MATKTILGKEYFDLQGAAEALALTPQTVRGYIKAGRLPAAKFGGQWLIDPAAMKNLITPRSAHLEGRVGMIADAKTVNGVDYITAEGVAKILDVTPRTVRLYARTGKLKAIKLTGKYLMLPEDVEKFISNAPRTGVEHKATIAFIKRSVK